MNDELRNLIDKFHWTLSPEGRVAIAIIWLGNSVPLEDIERVLGVSMAHKCTPNTSRLDSEFQQDNVDYNELDQLSSKGGESISELLERIDPHIEKYNLEEFLNKLEEILEESYTPPPPPPPGGSGFRP